MNASERCFFAYNQICKPLNEIFSSKAHGMRQMEADCMRSKGDDPCSLIYPM